MKSSVRTSCVIAFVCAFTTATAAKSDLRVRFVEGAPKDKFVIENTGDCAISDSRVLLDLSTSKGKLIFDVTSQGGGVNVFQPFELVEGGDALATLPSVVDGQSEIQLEISNLKPQGTIAFTIDVDDTIGQREITVSGAEIQGATVSYVKAEQKQTAVFTANSDALLVVSDC